MKLATVFFLQLSEKGTNYFQHSHLNWFPAVGQTFEPWEMRFIELCTFSAGEYQCICFLPTTTTVNLACIQISIWA